MNKILKVSVFLFVISVVILFTTSYLVHAESLSSWNANTSLPTSTYGATSVVYNGYVYEIGGFNGGTPVTTVDYAHINSNGTLGTWTATTSLPLATAYATSVVYNGYVYVKDC